MLRADPTRVFDRGAFRFRYPREFVFEFDADESADTWTLSGNDAKILVHRVRLRDPGTLLADSVKGSVDGWSPDGTKVTIAPVALRLGTREVGGLRVEGRVLSARMRQDSALFQTGGATWILTAQDSLGEDGSSSRDASVIEDLLRTTFEIR